jgi:hypothetical protein
MNCINYFFRVRITSASSIIGEDGIFAQALQNCRDVSIKSKNFAIFGECHESLTRFLDSLSIHQAYLDDAENAITTQANPGNDDEEWDRNTILRMFITNPFSPDGDDETYMIMGQIDAVEDQTVIIRNPYPLAS